MDPIDLDRNIQIKLNAGFQFSLKSGDFIYISVIKKVAVNKWAIGIHGKTVPAYSDIELKPGDIIRAQVFIKGNKINLKLMEDKGNLLQEKLQQQGIANDKLSMLIISSLIKAGMAVDAYTIDKIKQLLKIFKKDDRGIISLLIHVFKKGISLDSPQIHELLSLLNYGEKRKEKKERKRKQENSAYNIKAKKVIKECILRSDDNINNILAVFNQLKAEGENWIIIPYDFNLEQIELSGTIRVLYDPYSKKVLKMVVIVWANDEQRWSFIINTERTPKTMKIYSDSKQMIKKAANGLSELALKLDNNNVKIDDTKFEDENFDGFYPVDEVNYYKSIDTLQ
ncbi:MAG: hypothetical protein JW822_12060 [Spirochaetales bacterium]|nr:hypothetical protein [Spirochaetales bacterium]